MKKYILFLLIAILTLSCEKEVVSPEIPVETQTDTIQDQEVSYKINASFIGSEVHLLGPSGDEFHIPVTEFWTRPTFIAESGDSVRISMCCTFESFGDIPEDGSMETGVFLNGDFLFYEFISLDTMGMGSPPFTFCAEAKGVIP